jgi:uncharacterized membrane protein YeaQ/YmgE (transglycosylase-associated protein family)
MSNRKLMGFDPETRQALELFACDSGKSFQQLADEAFTDLLAKHRRPRTLKGALKQSWQREPENENKSPRRHRHWRVTSKSNSWSSLRLPRGWVKLNPAAKRFANKGAGMSAETLLIILLVGLIAGWLTGQLVRGTGFGLIADIAIGIVGALLGSWMLPRLGIHLGSGIVPAIIGATIGAIVLLLILRLAYRRGRWWPAHTKFLLIAKTQWGNVMAKAVARKKRVVRRDWTRQEVKELKKHSKDKRRVKTIARALKRTPAAVRGKAQSLGIPLGHRRTKKSWDQRNVGRRASAPREAPDAAFESIPAGLNWRSGFVEALFSDIPIHDLLRACIRGHIRGGVRISKEGGADR